MGTRIRIKRGTESQITGYAGPHYEGELAYATNTGSVFVNDGTQFITVGGSSETPTLQSVTDAGSTTTNSIGINTASPSYPLHVVGNSLITGTQFIGDTFSRIQQGSGDLIFQNSFPTGGIVLRTDSIERMRIDSSGKVGIGTTTPRELLEITKYGHPANIRLNQSGGTIGIGDVLGSIQFSGEDVQVPTDQQVGASISAVSEWGWGAGTEARTALVFSTRKMEHQVPTEYMRLNYLGYLGIGTSSPLSLLHVNTSYYAPITIGETTDATTKYNNIVSTQYSSTTESEGFSVLNTVASSPYNNLNIGGGKAENNAATQISFFTGATTSTRTGSARMTITKDGAVGIGTTAPDYKLTVSQSADSDGIKVIGFDDRSVDNLKIHINSSGSSEILSTTGLRVNSLNGQISFLYNSSLMMQIASTSVNVRDDVELAFGNDKDYSIGYNTVDDTFRIVDGSNLSSGTRLLIDSTGNVGIGTTAPAEKLEVAGNIKLRTGDYLKSSTRTNILLDRPSDARMVFNTLYQSSTTGGYDFTTGSTSRMVITGDGNVGIGTTAPSEKLHVSGNVLATGGTVTAYASNTSKAIISNVSGGGRLQLISDDGDIYLRTKGGDSYFNAGNVGIGTTAPDAKLHVSTTSGTAFKVNPNDTNREWYIDTTNPDHLKKGQNLILHADPTNVHTSTFISFNIDGSNKMHIQHDGAVGIGTTSPTSNLNINGSAMRQLRLQTSGGPSGNTDTAGNVGDIAYDDLYFYIKTTNGWGRVALDFAF